MDKDKILLESALNREMELTIINEYKNYQPDKNTYLSLFEITAKELDKSKEITASLILTDDQHIKDINRSYRGIDKATDVISFAMNDSDDAFDMDLSNELGDIFISVDRAQVQAKELNHTLEDELIFLFTHGLLHLLGFDHQNEQEERLMFATQDRIVNKYHEVSNK